MYTELEMQAIVLESSSTPNLKNYIKGYIVIKKGHTINYYRKGIDGLWYNYDCRTVY